MTPLESIVSKFKSEEAEAVAAKAVEENREALEMEKMAAADDPKKAILVPFEDEEQLEKAPKEDIVVEEQAIEEDENVKDQQMVATTPDAPVLDLKLSMDAKTAYKQDVPLGVGAASSSLRPEIDEPRSSPTTRSNAEGDDEHSSKKARMSPLKKLRIDRVAEDMVSCIRTVSIGDEELYTIDEPDTDPLEHNTLDEIYDFEYDDSPVDGKELPECLWYHGETDEKPPEPEGWIDKVAEEVELKRLTKMEVIRVAMDGADDGIQKL